MKIIDLICQDIIKDLCCEKEVIEIIKLHNNELEIKISNKYILKTLVLSILMYEDYISILFQKYEHGKLLKTINKPTEFCEFNSDKIKTTIKSFL